MLHMISRASGNKLYQVEDCSCAVRYFVRLKGSDGKPIASSSADGDVVAVGTCKPKAFQVALKTMKEAEKANLLIKPDCEDPTRCILSLCEVSGTNVLGHLVKEALRPLHRLAVEGQRVTQLLKSCLACWAQQCNCLWWGE